jgi:hypothetical protein
MMTRINAAAVLLLASAAAAPLHAEDRVAVFFKELDTNGNGMIDPDEFTLRKGVILYMLDANHDLKIERKETKLSAAQFQKHAGPDGTIDGGEFFNMSATRFSAFDKNGDRTISREEFREQMAVIRSGQQTAETR